MTQAFVLLLDGSNCYVLGSKRPEFAAGGENDGTISSLPGKGPMQSGQNIYSKRVERQSRFNRSEVGNIIIYFHWPELPDVETTI
jgi:hypothetical protein